MLTLEMDNSGPHNNEVIADSEEEDINLELYSVTDSLPPPPGVIGIGIASIEYAVPPASRAGPSNTNGSGNKDISPIAPTSDPRPRPRPRPITKKRTDILVPQVDDRSPPRSPDSLDMLSSTANIADRAKMRSRKTTLKVVVPSSPGEHNWNKRLSDDIIELTSDEDDDFAPRPSSKSLGKVKARPKNNIKTKAKQAAINEADGTVPPPRPKPRPIRPRKKIDLPLSPDTSNFRPTSPVPSSSISVIPFRLIPSQLPPSDPPTSTAPTCDHPPIETLPNPETDVDVPCSSPSSLFSIPGSGSGKRKRRELHIDELYSDDDRQENTRMDVDKQTMPPPALPLPPSTFFAGSSSPTTREIPQILMIPEFTDPPMIPPTIDLGPTSSGSTKKAQKPRKPRKNTGADTGEEVLSKDITGTKTKVKGSNPRRKKVEVVIAERTKSKGKEKEKSDFKSREFINDEEDDSGIVQNSNKRQTPKPDSLTSLSSIPDSDEEYTRFAGPSKKKKTSLDDERGQPTGKVTTGKARESVSEGGGKRPQSVPIGKGKAKRVILSDGEDEGDIETADPEAETPGAKGTAQKRKMAQKRRKTVPDRGMKNQIEANSSIQIETNEHGKGTPKENIQPVLEQDTTSHPKAVATPTQSLFPSLVSRYSIAPKIKSTPMSELIRRVNSLPGSPFPSPHPRTSTSSSLRPLTPGSATAYSPYLKSSRSLLSRIAPLHPNRRTPPPPLPPPPPPKKTKKEREREEQWEEELVESVGGISEWACMTDGERKELRKAKWERETAGWEDYEDLGKWMLVVPQSMYARRRVSIFPFEYNDVDFNPVPYDPGNGYREQRLTTTVVPIRRGVLQRLREVPLDVLFEIFNHLHPMDLLRLARTTKTLRCILMRRSAAFVWKATILNVDGLPHCPPDLNEPQYVNLAFDHHCHFCLMPNVYDVYWSCRVRCCKACLEENFVSDFDLMKRVPFHPGDGKYKSIFPYIVYPKPRPYKPGRILYYLPVAEQYIHELGRLERNDAVVKIWSTEKKAEQARRLTHAALCESWSNHWVHKRSRELNLFLIVFLIIFLIVFRGGIEVL